jgi:hypothetical protein
LAKQSGSGREEHQPGLPSLNQARAERRRATPFGKARLVGVTPQFWIWVAVVLGAFGVVYWRITEGRLESQRSAVMAKQRAIAKTLGPKILPFRDRIEGWVQKLAGPWKGDYVAPSVDLSNITHSPGVYLRLDIENARSAKSIRKASSSSLHDGFTSCFFVRSKAVDPQKGPPCKALSDCAPGLLCNEWDVCTRPAEPYNMRLAYRALRVLSTEWSDELHQASSDLGITAYDRDLDRVTHNDVPIAIEILTRARYFTAVLDETPAHGLPKALGDAGAETDEQRVQRTDHFARIGVWDLQSGKQLAGLRARAQGRIIPVGDRVVRDKETAAAAQRQANSCMLALQLRAAIQAEVVKAAPADAGAPSAQPPPAASGAPPAPSASGAP